MKRFATTMAFLLSITATGLTVSAPPSVAMDGLRQLAQVSHAQAESSSDTLADIARNQKEKVSTPQKPKKPQ